jgi:hypothetical protein
MMRIGSTEPVTSSLAAGDPNMAMLGRECGHGVPQLWQKWGRSHTLQIGNTFASSSGGGWFSRARCSAQGGWAYADKLRPDV